MHREELLYWQDEGTNLVELWQEMPCLLIDDGDGMGRIEAIRGHVGACQVGDSFWRATGLSEAKIQKLRKAYQTSQGVWAFSALGAGVLSSQFYGLTGKLVYFGVHSNVSVVKMICGQEVNFGLISPCPYPQRIKKKEAADTVAYVQALNHWQYVKAALRLWRVEDLAVRLSCIDVRELLQDMAAIAGCQLKCCSSVIRMAAGSCYDSRTLRYIYLRWLMFLQSVGACQPIELYFYEMLSAERLCGVVLKAEVTCEEGASLGETLLRELRQVVAQQQVQIQYRVDRDFILLGVVCMGSSLRYVEGDFKADITLVYDEE